MTFLEKISHLKNNNKAGFSLGSISMEQIADMYATIQCNDLPGNTIVFWQLGEPHRILEEASYVISGPNQTPI